MTQLFTHRVRLILETLLLFTLAWYVAALVIANPSRLPTPWSVLLVLIELSIDGGPGGDSALYHLGVTLMRVIGAVILTMIVAICVGVFMGTDRRVELISTPIIPLLMTIPSVIIVFITLIALSFRDSAVILATCIIAFPHVTVMIWKGASAVENDLIEMASAFKATRFDMYRHVVIPYLSPYIFASLRIGVGIIWKVAVLAEVFGTQNGIGAMFRFWFNQGDVGALLSYTILFVGVMIVFEYIVLARVESTLYGWRDVPTV